MIAIEMLQISLKGVCISMISLGNFRLAIESMP